MYTVNTGYAPANFFASSGNADGSTLGRLKAFGGLTFYKNYATSQVNGNADYSIGVGTITVTSARSGAAPATFFDVNGVISTTTTANTPRFTQGFYDSTGFRLRPGLIVEVGGGGSGVGKNVLKSSIAAFTAIDWVATTITANDAEAATQPATTVSSLTASAGNGTIVQAFVDAVAGVYTASIFIKRKTGTGIINLRANILDSYTDITANVGSSWTRVQVQSTSRTNPAFDIQLVTNGDAIFVYGAQLEKYPYMTSFVPTTAAALTRAAEVVTYPIASNRTASAESIFIKATPLGGSFSNDSITRTITDSDTKGRQIKKTTTIFFARSFPNNTDNATVFATTTTQPIAGTSYVFNTGFEHVANPGYVTISMNGVLENSYGAADWTNPAWGTNFYIGSPAQFNGIFQSIAIYNSFRDVPEVNHISSILDSSITYNNYAYTYQNTSNISGGNSGNALVLTTYEFVNAMIQVDSDTIMVYGIQDPETVAPSHAIRQRAFTISTGSFGTATIVYDQMPTWAAVAQVGYVVGGKIRLYLSKVLQSDTTQGAITYIESTDLTGTSWGAEVSVRPLGPGGIPLIRGYMRNYTPGLDYIFIQVNNNNDLYTSNDGGNTFVFNSRILVGNSYTEMQFVAMGGGKIFGVARKSAGGYLHYLESSDDGTTWTFPSSTGMGQSTGVKPTPALITSPGTTNSVTVQFYDRGDNRNYINAAVSYNNAFNNIWPATSFIGTQNGQGNGNCFGYVDANNFRRYLVILPKEMNASTTTDWNWWTLQDNYAWTIV